MRAGARRAPTPRPHLSRRAPHHIAHVLKAPCVQLCTLLDLPVRHVEHKRSNGSWRSTVARIQCGAGYSAAQDHGEEQDAGSPDAKDGVQWKATWLDDWTPGCVIRLLTPPAPEPPGGIHLPGPGAGGRRVWAVKAKRKGGHVWTCHAMGNRKAGKVVPWQSDDPAVVRQLITERVAAGKCQPPPPPPPRQQLILVVSRAGSFEELTVGPEGGQRLGDDGQFHHFWDRKQTLMLWQRDEAALVSQETIATQVLGYNPNQCRGDREICQHDGLGNTRIGSEAATVKLRGVAIDLANHEQVAVDLLAPHDPLAAV